MFTTTDYIHEPLYVVTSIFNPIRYKSRWKLYERFAKQIKDSGAILVTVEAAFGERHHALQAGETQHNTPVIQRAPTTPTEFHHARSTEPHQYIRVRTNDEIWIKENLLNIGIQRLPENWKYVACVDADTMFARTNWVGETIHQLQHYKVVQMFSEAQDVDPNYNSVGQVARGFASCHVDGVPSPKGFNPTYYYAKADGQKKDGPILWHPGFAWAYRRDAIDDLGGLVDFALMGAADNHMAYALVGRVDESYHPKVQQAYKERLREWQYRAEKHIRRDIGCVSGLLLHYWHGKKLDRKYWDRWKVIVDNKFNPDTDLKYDYQGVLQLVDRGTERSIKLRDDARKYFRARNEDSIDV